MYKKSSVWLIASADGSPVLISLFGVQSFALRASSRQEVPEVQDCELRPSWL